MPKTSKKTNNGKGKKSKNSHGHQKSQNCDPFEMKLKLEAIAGMRTAERTNVAKRVSTGEAAVNKVVKQVMKNKNFSPVCEFKYNIKVEPVLDFIHKWKGCTKSKITTQKEYYDKGISWLNGRRSPMYGKTLFPQMVDEAVVYCKKIAKMAHPNDKPSRTCLENLLTASVLLELCRAKVYTKMAGEKPLFCQNAFKTLLGQKIANLVPSVDTNEKLDSYKLEEILKAQEQSLTSEYNNLRHNIRNEIEPIHISYVEPQNNDDAASDTNPIDHNEGSNGDDVDSVIDEEENEDAEKEEQQKSKKNGKHEMEEDNKKLKSTVEELEYKLRNEIKIREEILKQQLEEKFKQQFLVQSFCPSISPSSTSTLHYNSQCNTNNVNDQRYDTNMRNMLPFNPSLTNSLASSYLPLPLPQLPVVNTNEQEHDTNANMMNSFRPELIFPHLNMHFFPLNVNNNSPNPNPSPSPSPNPSSNPNPNLNLNLNPNLNLNINKINLSPIHTSVTNGPFSNGQSQLENISSPLPRLSPLSLLDQDNPIYSDYSFPNPLSFEFPEENCFTNLFNDVQPMQNLGEPSMDYDY